MEMGFTDLVPQAISILFLFAITVPVFMVARLVRKGSGSAQEGRRNFWAVLIFYATYSVYVCVACFNGLFDKAALPPTILRYTTIPLLLLLMVVVFNSVFFREMLKRLELADLVRVHIFRLVGSFFLILGFYKALPSSISVIAGLGDVITAVSSLFVASAITQRKSYARKLAFAWNTFGMLDILATSFMASRLTMLSMQNGSQGVEVLGQFPFCLIPAIAPATILFLHFSIYRKLLSQS